jgi:nitrate reductase alpha subunit
MTASCTNPFLLAFPKTPLARIHDTRSDYEILAGVAERLADLSDEPRMRAYWSGILDGDPTPYLQRILSGSNATRGILYDELHSSCADGVPFLMNPRTYPRHAGWEQRQEDKPWYTPTGRLEFYRPEREWQEAGESLPVWREPVDATFHEPNVILSNRRHPSITPKAPEEYGVGVPARRRDAPVPERRPHVAGAEALEAPAHGARPAYRFIFQTPKYRWERIRRRRLGLDRDALRAVRRPVSPRPANALDGRGVCRDQPRREGTRRQGR